MNKKVIIIGAGPSGVSSAVQLKRAGIEVLILEQNKIGGLLNSANLVENYLGFPNGIKGNKLTELISKHIAELNIPINFETVCSASFENNKFNIKTDKNTYSSDYLIVGSGTTPKEHGFNIPDACKKHVYSKIYDLLKIKDNHIVIIGASDAAFDYALNIATNNRVTIFVRNNITCLPLLYDRARENKNIEIIKNIELEQIKHTNNKLELISKKDKKTCNYKTNYLLFAIGRQPNLEFLKVIPAFAGLHKKLFLVGDVKNGFFRQASIAAADGIKAAMEILKSFPMC